MCQSNLAMADMEAKCLRSFTFLEANKQVSWRPPWKKCHACSRHVTCTLPATLGVRSLHVSCTFHACYHVTTCMHPACMLHECYMNMHVSYLVLGRFFLGKFHAWTCTIHIMRMLLAWLHVAITAWNMHVTCMVLCRFHAYTFPGSSCLLHACIEL